MPSFGANYTCTVKTSWGEYAWKAEDIQQAYSSISMSCGVILGGDVISPEMKSTNDSWFYQPTWELGDHYSSALRKNTEKSIHCAAEYISRYIELHGKGFLFTLVVCTGNEALLYASKRM